jgi:uncharacterized coiled-coil DUF342 family protein
VKLINEKSVSKSQQRLFGMVYALKTGELDKTNIEPSLLGKITDISKNISKKDAKKLASTKHEELPNKVDELNLKVKSIKEISSILKQSGFKFSSVKYENNNFILESNYPTFIKIII